MRPITKRFPNQDKIIVGFGPDGTNVMFILTGFASGFIFGHWIFKK